MRRKMQYLSVLSRDNITFHPDTSVTITFFGIKNDSSRSGFEVRIPPSDVPNTDPICALKQYISRIQDLTHESGPLFLSLHKFTQQLRLRQFLKY